MQPQKMVNGSKFWIEKVEGLYYLCNENTDADQLFYSRLFKLFSMLNFFCLYSTEIF